MGKLLYSMIVSLDGYVADREGEFSSWAQPDEQVLAAINEELEDVSTYLLGRRMYEMMAVWETDAEVIEQSPESMQFARIWQSADKVVYSRRLESVPTRRTRLRSEFDPQEVAQLTAGSDGVLTIDGPTVAGEAIGHGLVDQIDVLLCPVTLGGGLRFLPDHRLDLALRDEQRFDNGMVQLRYDVLPTRSVRYESRPWPPGIARPGPGPPALCVPGGPGRPHSFRTPGAIAALRRRPPRSRRRRPGHRRPRRRWSPHRGRPVHSARGCWRSCRGHCGR